MRVGGVGGQGLADVPVLGDAGALHAEDVDDGRRDLPGARRHVLVVHHGDARVARQDAVHDGDAAVGEARGEGAHRGRRAVRDVRVVLHVRRVEEGADAAGVAPLVQVRGEDVEGFGHRQRAVGERAPRRVLWQRRERAGAAGTGRRGGTLAERRGHVEREGGEQRCAEQHG